MYILWSRGFDDVNFPMPISTNSTVQRAKRSAHSHGFQSDEVNDGMVMAQLLRPDNLEIPEKLVYVINADPMS